METLLSVLLAFAVPSVLLLMLRAAARAQSRKGD